MANDKEKKNGGKMAGFKWDEERSQAALLLAEGLTQQAVADKLGKGLRTIERWVAAIEFSAEVDRLSLMTGIASRAERMRIAKRIVNQKTKDEIIITDKDLLDWLKFAQGETDGVKLDLAALAAAFGEDETSLA